MKIDPLIEALTASAASGDEGLTVEEMFKNTGSRKETIRARLRVLMGEGRLIVGRKPTSRIDGQHVFVPCYRLR